MQYTVVYGRQTASVSDVMWFNADSAEDAVRQWAVWRLGEWRTEAVVDVRGGDCPRERLAVSRRAEVIYDVKPVGEVP